MPTACRPRDSRRGGGEERRRPHSAVNSHGELQLPGFSKIHSYSYNCVTHASFARRHVQSATAGSGDLVLADAHHAAGQGVHAHAQMASLFFIASHLSIAVASVYTHARPHNSHDPCTNKLITILDLKIASTDS